MSGKFALIIGNTEYTDPGLAQLTSPGKDAQDLAYVLQDQDICAFDDVKVLLNQPEQIVREAMDEFFDQKKPDDLLILYFSGHGVRDELGALYLAVKNTNRFRLRSTAVKSDFVREAMDQSRSKRQVLILDCCNSGAFAQGIKAATGVSIGIATAFEAGYGRVILTASDSTQFAWEGDKIIGETDNSLFTHYLVEGLKGEADLNSDGYITVDELYDYAYEKVKLVTPRQTPSKFSSKQQGEIILRQFMRIEDIKPVSLSDQLISEIENPYPEVRLRAVGQLGRLLNGRNLGLARSAREALERLEQEDDSRRVSQAASQVLSPIRLDEQLELQKAEEGRLAAEKAEAEQKVRVEAEQLLAKQKAEEAERLAFLKAEEERLATEKVAAERKTKEEVARVLAWKKAEEERIAKAEREALEQARRERAERNAARRKEIFDKLRAQGQAKWGALVHYLQGVPRERARLYLWLGLVIPVVAAITILFYQQLNTPTLFFSSSVRGETDVYSYDDNAVIKFTLSADGARNWEPVVGPMGALYFTSDRTGKAEIYRLHRNGIVQQVTNTPGSGASWSPALGPVNQLYFTSNRTGKAEIYRLHTNGTVQQVTDTPGSAASWSPALGPVNQLYFTSNRSGKAEIYRFKADGTVQQLTNTLGTAASWSPALGSLNQLYFTSDRAGKAEIYRFKADGTVQRITNTPGSAASWSPVIRGKTIYFTSNRGGRSDVYFLDGSEAVKISSSGSWTGTFAERFPTLP